MIIKKKEQNLIKPTTVAETPQQEIPVEPKKPKEPTEEEVINSFKDIDITDVDFKERFERRRGDRRRGYRRIDERSLVSRAQSEAQKIRETAAQEGYKEGLKTAQDEVEALKEALLEFLQTRGQMYEAASKDILEIALEVAKKIIKKEVELSDDVLKNVVKDVLEELNSGEQKITIKVSPEQLEFARASIPEMLENSRLEAKISVMPDDSVEKGSCIVVADSGTINASFASQLQIIQNAFGIYKNYE